MLIKINADPKYRAEVICTDFATIYIITNNRIMKLLYAVSCHFTNLLLPSVSLELFLIML